jgi:uncharacterized protein YndB with AHSA1/START domain
MIRFRHGSDFHRWRAASACRWFRRLMALPRISLVRRLPADARTVYRAWTDPEKLASWWGGGGASQMVAQCKPVRKGSFFVTGRRADGTTFQDWGTYIVVLPDEVLEFSWNSENPQPCYVVMQLLAVPGGTELSLVHFGLPDAAVCERQHGYWTEAFDCLEAVLSE